MYYFTADTHFSHTNIIKFCERPFSNIREHDNALIENWNSVVNPTDVVYHLGDFGFGAPGYLVNIIKQLNGKIRFIKGNHDKSIKGGMLGHIDWIRDYAVENIQWGRSTHQFVLFHYPIENWYKKHYGTPHLHGHSHGKASFCKNRFDVGVDSNNYKPISFLEILERTNG